MGQLEQDLQDRIALAAAIERRAADIVERWLDRVRADAAAEHVPLTELRDGIRDYLGRIAELLRGGSSLGRVGTSAWSDVTRGHAITRVRLGFDVAQLFHEIVVLRAITMDVLREEGLAEAHQQDERVILVVDAAIASSIKSYVEFRDYTTRRREAEHVGFLTHELKTPLAAAALAADQLRQSATVEQRHATAVLDRNLTRLRRLVDDVLLTERLEAGEVESRPVDVELGSLFKDAVAVTEHAARAKHLAFTARYDPRLTIRADPQLTLSATENLLDNAVKYTDAGAVELEVEDLPEEIVVHVRDHCSGLSPEELDVIFEPFKRAHSRRPGAGLGLAITRRAVEAQGGQIHAESSVDAGCHFWFTLPKTHH